MDQIYVIKRAWVNPFYTWGERGYGYVDVGFAMTEDEAKQKCDGCQAFTKKMYSFLKGDLPEYIYGPLPRFDGHKLYERVDTIEEAVSGH